jgi:L-rhamnose-H+ transport protein
MDTMNVTTGIFLGILAGMLLGSFALPMKKVKIWQWEHSWVMFSFWATIVLPLLMAILTIPNLMAVYTQTLTMVILAVFLFGAGWGVAMVAYGIGLKMVGLAMGTAIVLGLNNAIGAILPIFLYSPEKLLQPVGLALSAAVLVMISGIIVLAVAGMKREKALASDSNKNDQIPEKSQFLRGFLICLVAGVFGAMFNFAFINGKPMETVAIGLGATPINAANPTWVIALSGGFVVTLAYCLYLFKANKNSQLFFASGTRMNWIFTLIMGLMWYGGVAIYGMSVSKLGALGASIGWPIFKSMAVGSGNFWGIVTGEWKGAGKSAIIFVTLGLLLLFTGIVIVGYSASLN